MDITVSAVGKNTKADLTIPGSKSISNRLLILQALFPNLQIEKLSNSDDTKILQKALVGFNQEIPAFAGIVDIGHAGTAMRFLTAYFSAQEGKETILTGSPRMKQRPIGVLVDALNGLGADISYLEKEGFPPLLIKGKKITTSKTSLDADVSSQYISALMLVAPVFQNGLEITLRKKPVSTPYIEMTRSLLLEAGIDCFFENEKIKIPHTNSVAGKKVKVESDWSSASYFYSIAALSDSAEISLGDFKENSFQGDSILPEIYAKLGVETFFSGNKIHLKKIKKELPKFVALNLSDTPDLAQTIAVTCLGLQIPCELSGLHTLKIKETNRLEAMKNELEKFGAKVDLTNDSLSMEPSEKLPENSSIKTYADHRMAMAFAPLATKTPIIIENAEVVSKSYMGFWEELAGIGFVVKENKF